MNPIIKSLVRSKRKYANRLFHIFLTIAYGKNLEKGNTNFGRYFEFDVAGGHYKIRFGKNVIFKKFSIVSVREGAELTIGSNVFFNTNISINCRNKISIGDNCMFGENVKLYDHNHRFSKRNMLFSGQGYTNGQIVIGKNCWIGSNVTILKNVEIGENVVIGANCLIYKSIAANTVVKANAQLHFETLKGHE